MKRAIGFACLGVLALVGCATGLPHKSPVTGFLFTSVQGADNVTENPVSAKSNKLCATGLLGNYAFGSAAAAGAAGADIKRISIVDTDMFTLLGLYTTHCTIVHDGGNAETVPTAAPVTVPEGGVPAAGGDGGAAVVATTPTTTPTATATATTTATATATTTATATATTTATTTATATTTPTATAVVAVGVWPAAVGIADRTQCTYRCMNNSQPVDSGDLERHIGKQLGAIRQCARASSENRVMPSAATFGPDGKMVFSLDVSSVRRSMQECVAHIPMPGPFKGPPNAQWRCADYCQ